MPRYNANSGDKWRAREYSPRAIVRGTPMIIYGALSNDIM